MSTFKDYAKKAKQRMKSGFWQQAKLRMQEEQKVAATNGLDCHAVSVESHRRLERAVYDYDGFCAEQDFYGKVVAILESDELISNPIMRLADVNYMATLTAGEKQSYIMRLSAKYRQAVEKYHSMKK